MLKLPPPKNGGKTSFVEPSLPPPTSAASALVTDVVSRGRTNVKATPGDLRRTGFSDVLERSIVTREEEQATSRQTAQALQSIIEAKVAVTNQNQVVLDGALPNKTSTFIKVNATTDSVTGKTGQDRIFRLSEKAADPLEPPKIKYRAVPKGPGSPPVPILRSPSRKATEEEKEAWNVPPSISNWNNSRGYVISLEKRLAQTSQAEGPVVNDRFAQFAEALFSAEDAKRREVNERAKLRQVNEDRSRETENEALRIAAAQARAARAKATAASGANAMPVTGSMRSGGDTPPMPLRGSSPASSRSGDDDEQRGERIERERIRQERKRQIDREMRLEASGKRTKAAREEERDISERVALGMPVSKDAVGGIETEFDQRLFNRGGAGLSSGHGVDDEDAVYSSALFRDKAKDAYKPSSHVRETRTAAQLQSKLDEVKSGENKFVLESRGFKGAEGTSSSAVRQGPVLFERADTLGIAVSAPARRVADAMDSLSSRKSNTLSVGRFAGDTGARMQQASMDEPDERELEEDRMIKKLKEKESRSKQISFVKGSE